MIPSGTMTSYVLDKVRTNRYSLYHHSFGIDVKMLVAI